MICGTRARVQSDVRVWGSGGSIVVPIPWKPLQGEIVLTRSGQEPETIVVPAEADCYALEADVVAANMTNQQAPYPCMTWEDTLGNMKALDQWRASAGMVFDLEKEEHREHTMNKAKIGIIGVGWWGTVGHLEPLADDPKTELVAVWSRTEAKAKERAERYGVPHYYTDYRAMIDARVHSGANWTGSSSPARPICTMSRRAMPWSTGCTC